MLISDGVECRGDLQVAIDARSASAVRSHRHGGPKAAATTVFSSRTHGSSAGCRPDGAVTRSAAVSKPPDPCVDSRLVAPPVTGHRSPVTSLT